MSRPSTRQSAFLSGAKDTIPLVLGAIPFAIIFGALAVTAGLSPAATQSMSLFVFAGSAQFIAAGMLAQNAPVGLIVFTTFIVNLRHALYSASLGSHLRGLPQRWLLPLAFWLTDETYAVVVRRTQPPGPPPYLRWYYLGSALFMYANWQLCTLIGILAGQRLQGAETWGLDFAMVASFVGIVVPLITTRPLLVCALVSGAVALAANGLPHKLGLMLAALLGIAAGVITESLGAARRTQPAGSGGDA